MRIDRIDHLVLTVSDIERTCDFYSRVLGMRVVEFGNSRKALWFGGQKINLHQSGRGFEPKASSPTMGSADLCFVVRGPLSEALSEVERSGVKPLMGPVSREGSLGRMKSFYLRDPDGNLIEISSYRRD